MLSLESLIAHYQSFKAETTEIDPKKIAFKISHLPLEVRSFILWQYNPKAATKFGKYLPGILPAEIHVEQASGWQAAEFKAEIVGRNNRIIDLTGGLGIDGWAFSQFNQVLHIERNERLQSIASHNFRGNPRVESRCTDAEDIINQGLLTDWFFVDPDRRVSKGASRVAFENSDPNLLNIVERLLDLASIGVLVKASAMIDISLSCSQLGLVEKVYILSVHNECKEVLFVIKKEPKPIEIEAVEWNQCRFSFSTDQEKTARPSFSMPMTYIYEPFAAIMKAAPYKLLSERFGVNKLGASTHLYTSDKLIESFPGRIFKMSDSNTKLNQANIMVRNYPLDAEKLRKQLKIKDGGQSYIIACKLIDGSNKLIEAHRIK